MADIFISYTSSDRDWAFWIAKELEALGHVAHVHEWEIKGGDDIYAWMEQRHDAADHVLCVVSDEYLKAPYSTLERNAALWQAASKRPGFVLFVAAKPCKLPTLSDHVRRCELFGLPKDAARFRFREFMEKREVPTTVAFPGKVFAVSNIPIRVPTHFMGRDDALAEIETALKRYEGRVAITALQGLRGVGKTTLAACYAERHRGDYRATWWIRAQTEPGMRADLVGLGVRLAWVDRKVKADEGVAVVLDRLRHEGEGILLIYDNAVDARTIGPFLPKGGRARVLVTSNAHEWRQIAEPVEIKLWPKTIGADYLVARTGWEDQRAAAETLSETLGGLPLAHEQAAAYCADLAVGFGDYTRRFEAAPSPRLDDADYAPTDYHDGLTVAKTFGLAIDEVKKAAPAAEMLISHTALLAPDAVPLILFANGRESFPEPLKGALVGDGIDRLVAVLRRFALVDRVELSDEHEAAAKTPAIRLHRLVRLVAATRLDAVARATSLRSLIAALVAIYPQDGFRNARSWSRYAQLTPHLIELWPLYTGKKSIDADWADLLAWAGEIAGEIERTSDDPEVALQEKEERRALRKCLQMLSPEHREVIDLTYYHEKTIDEVAEIIGVPQSTVKTRLFYARKRLVELLRVTGVRGE